MRTSHLGLISGLAICMGLTGLAAAAPAPPVLPRPSIEADEANPQLIAGLERRVIQVGGQGRVYYIHRPASLRAGPAPIVIGLHGGNGTALRRARQMGFNEIGDREGFIAVYPQGVDFGWNDGRVDRGVDDVQFFRALLDDLVARKDADPSRIYLVGGSNGGMMAQRLACDMTGRLAGVVTMVASLPEPLAKACSPKAPLPILMMNGTADPLVPYGGGAVAATTGREQGRVLPVEDTLAFWQRANRCADKPVRGTVPDRDPADQIMTETVTWTACAGGSEVSFYKMNGAGHGLPGRSRNKSDIAEQLGGRSTNDFDSSEVAWAFLKRFKR